MHETGACTNNGGGITTGRVTNLDQVHATGPQDHSTTCHMPQSSCQPGPPARLVDAARQILYAIIIK